MGNYINGSGFNEGVGSSVHKRLERNMSAFISTYSQNANQRTPYLSGTLRSSMKTKKKGVDGEVSWNTDYADKVYNKNYKNPKTEKWAEKEWKQNKSLYKKILGK